MQIERDSLGVREREPSDHRRLDPFQQDALLPVTGHGHVQANLVPTGPDVGAWFPLIVTGHLPAAVNGCQRRGMQLVPGIRGYMNGACGYRPSLHLHLHRFRWLHPLSARHLPHGDDQRHHRNSIAPTSVIQPLQNIHNTSFPALRRLVVSAPSSLPAAGKGPTSRRTP